MLGMRNVIKIHVATKLMMNQTSESMERTDDDQG